MSSDPRKDGKGDKSSKTNTSKEKNSNISPKTSFSPNGGKGTKRKADEMTPHGSKDHKRRKVNFGGENEDSEDSLPSSSPAKSGKGKSPSKSTMSSPYASTSPSTLYSLKQMSSASTSPLSGTFPMAASTSRGQSSNPRQLFTSPTPALSMAMSSPRGASAPATPGRSNPTAKKITIQQIYNNGDTTNESRFLTAQIVKIQPDCEPDEHVKKTRRRAILADKNASILTFIMTDKLNHLKEGECIFLSNFRVNYKAIIIHDKSKVSNHNPIQMPDHICYEGTLMYACPVTPEISIEAAQKLTKGNHVTIRGRIVETEPKRLISDKQGNEKYVKEIILAEQSATIRVTLWDAAAAYFDHDIGSSILVMDGVMFYSKHYQSGLVSVNFPDQLWVIPSEESTEVLKLVAISYTDSAQKLAVTAIRDDIVDTCYIDIDLLMATVGSNLRPTIHNALKYFPCEFEVKLLGNIITSIVRVISFQIPVEIVHESPKSPCQSETSEPSDNDENDDVDPSQNKSPKKESEDTSTTPVSKDTDEEDNSSNDDSDTPKRSSESQHDDNDDQDR